MSRDDHNERSFYSHHPDVIGRMAMDSERREYRRKRIERWVCGFIIAACVATVMAMAVGS